MANVRGIFRLKQVYEEQLSNNWPVKSDVWLSPSGFYGPASAPVGYSNGYFSGGVQPSNSPSFPTSIFYSTVSRIDYSNDTTTVPARGSLTGVVYRHAGTGNQDFGYVGGGSPYDSRRSVVDRIDYSNDTATAASKGPLSLARFQLAATGNASFGYFIGGRFGPYSTIDRIDYTNDTANASPKGPLSAGVYDSSGTGNQSFGYSIGGKNFPVAPGQLSTVDRIDYSNDTATAAPKGPLSVQRSESGSTGNSDFGYIGGGYNTVPGSNNWLSNVDRIDYSNDTATTSPKGPLSRTMGTGCATGDKSFGYFGGGEGNNNENLSTLDRIDYSNDTATALSKGPLSHSLRKSAASSSKANANPTRNDTLFPASDYPHNISLDGVFSFNTGYFIGGSPGPISTVDRVDYSNDTATASVKGPLSAVSNYHAVVSSVAHTYKLGGSGVVSTVDRIDHSNDTATTSVKGPLSEPVYRSFTAMGNANFGYLAGGQRPAIPATSTTVVDRIDYSNDTATAVAKGPIASARYLSAGVGNQSFGYVVGGSPPFQDNSLVQRIDYSNDTATASPKGPLNTGRRKLAGAGNANFGYIGGGSNPSTTSIDRIEYSNDTATALAKGFLNVSRETFGSTSNNTNVYFGGGGSTNSSVDRIDYTNDTATASPRGNLSIVRWLFAAAGGRDDALPQPPLVNVPVPVETGRQHIHGYIFGGSGDPSLSPAVNQPTQRIDFTNDTVTAAVRGAPAAPAGGNLYYNFAVGNRNYAYTGNAGNTAPAPIQRFDYSNETNSLVVKGAINTVLIGAGGPTSSVGGYNASATGNHHYGWINGGYKLYSVPAPSGYYSAFSQIDRIDYSNDTADTLRRSYTTNRFGTGSATGTNSYGYWIGGSTDMTTYNGVSTLVDRTDYSNDTTNAAAKGNLSTVHGRESDSIGNKNYGYVAGGRPTSSTIVDRIDYSNDTATAVLKGPLTTARYGMSTTGSQSYGYFCGGSPGSPQSTVERIDYSNDTATASPKGPLAYIHRHGSGASTTYNELSTT